MGINRRYYAAWLWNKNGDFTEKIGEENLNIPTEALTYIANQIQSNIRELEGALTRVLAFSKLQGQPITTELTAEALKDIIQAPKSKNHDTRYSENCWSVL